MPKDSQCECASDITDGASDKGKKSRKTVKSRVDKARVVVRTGRTNMCGHFPAICSFDIGFTLCTTGESSWSGIAQYLANAGPFSPPQVLRLSHTEFDT